MLSWFSAKPTRPLKQIPNFLGIARTVIRIKDPRYPDYAHLGEYGARKAALAALGAFQRMPDGTAWIDEMERSISAQYASRTYCKETRPDWIDILQEAA